MSETNKNPGMRVIPAGEKKCIWMDAGVVSYKLCTNQFLCTNCAFDLAMSNQAQKDQQLVKENKISAFSKQPKVEWMEKFRDLPSDQRKCRYMLMGEVSYKVCPNNFYCGTCTYDQMMQDRIQPGIEQEIDSFEKVVGFYVSDDLYYFRNHVWVQLERNGKYRLGIDDFARRLIGKVKKIDLPAVGKSLEFEEYGWSIKHDYGDLELFSPIKGVVDQVNHQLIKNNNLLVEEPYNRGWLMTIEPDNIMKSNKNLFKGKDTRAWMFDEVDLLNRTIQSTGLETMHDGAEMVMDISKHLSQDKWQEVMKNHLHVK